MIFTGIVFDSCAMQFLHSFLNLYPSVRNNNNNNKNKSNNNNNNNNDNNNNNNNSNNDNNKPVNYINLLPTPAKGKSVLEPQIGAIPY